MSQPGIRVDTSSIRRTNPATVSAVWYIAADAFTTTAAERPKHVTVLHVEEDNCPCDLSGQSLRYEADLSYHGSAVLAYHWFPTPLRHKPKIARYAVFLCHIHTAISQDKRHLNTSFSARVAQLSPQGSSIADTMLPQPTFLDDDSIATADDGTDHHHDDSGYMSTLTTPAKPNDRRISSVAPSMIQTAPIPAPPFFEVLFAVPSAHLDTHKPPQLRTVESLCNQRYCLRHKQTCLEHDPTPSPPMCPITIPQLRTQNRRLRRKPRVRESQSFERDVWMQVATVFRHHQPTMPVMSEHDYAAPLSQERRASLFLGIFGSVRPSSFRWDSTPSLTAPLREGFPGLLPDRLPAIDPPPVPAILEAFQSDYHTGVTDQRPARSDSVQEHDPHDNHGRRPQTARRDAESGQVPATSRPPPVRSQSPAWFANSHEHPRAAPNSSARMPPPTYHQHLHATHLRDDQGHLFYVPNTSHLPSLEQTLRRCANRSSLRSQVSQDDGNQTQDRSTTTARRNATSGNAAAQSSLRNIVSREHNGQVRDGSTSHGITSATITSNRNAVTGTGGYSRFTSYSPSAEAYVLPPISRSSSAARLALSRSYQARLSPRSTRSRTHETHRPTITEQQASASSPTSNSLSPLELQELQDQHTPLPTPIAPYAQHPSPDRNTSTASIVTFDNPNSSSPPLTLIQANLVALADLVSLKQYTGKCKIARSWKAKLSEYGKRIRNYTQVLCDAESHERKMLRCKIDVLWTGPLKDCKCIICIKRLGPPRDWKTDAIRAFHEVPRGRWLDTSPLGYHKLNWGVPANQTGMYEPEVSGRGLGAIRLGEDGL
ncbi:uncharacterized protein M421DRAFT_95267 [Didymella exigua CBS 183.55]|uniref:Uncharacterized protein n=1 Tax=Didymella exigua CBS 183.55 TaxID=1150837 RepID=A0A6A5RBK1_9PLEO|nr:uncharacterized protein M421DRAFT_95267 [Didymella exigua CBS 183.55]KAF1924729.1 hypothetical protein M421DRAFT_95267 [Didymella exigua CBS 183.55]